ncbi:metalloregulator ArsR/SmtB family transcription factor [Vibrio sp. AND4]|uniref:ArsR/SmtB family transcription factor n=1 Tax=Vibrio sp. AND4 TaxID=314289 RepID=UPI00015F0D62|nr:metalloregulator ArsR/SmtB family transcription factor [Vibrio sp. AND4]EDP57104.1 predicted transcriptional regulator [Vibrio sp. AND4]
MGECMLESANKASELLKIMAHPERLIVMCKLIESEKGVGELFENSSLSQSAFSQHLTVLRKHNIIKARKVSQQVFYSIADERVGPLIEALKYVFSKSSFKH